ncbi:MAG: ATP-dependent Clp protease ATP-binding subunit, partial [Candidatus Saccharimonas sp.]
MEDLRIDFMSARSHLARLGVRLRSWVAILPWLIALFFLGGVAIIVWLGDPLGWLLIATTPLIYMIYRIYFWYLVALPAGKSNSITSLLSGDILGRLRINPSVLDVVEALAQTASGRFLSLRFGLTPGLVRSLASEDPNAIRELWKSADSIRQEHGLSLINGSVVTVAIIRSFSNYESIIAHIHLDSADLDHAIAWQERLQRMIDLHEKPRRTGGIARDWSFGWIPLLDRFGRNISKEMQGRMVLPTVKVPSHMQTVDQLVDTFSSGGRQNAVLVGAAGAGKTTIIHAFANRLLDADTPLSENLRFRQVFILDSSALISAAPGRGELENLVLQVLGEAY